MSISTSGETNDLQQLALEEDALLVEARRRLAVRESALIQAALGLEFTLSGFNKLADPHYAANFNAFVRSTPGAPSMVGTITVTK